MDCIINCYIFVEVLTINFIFMFKYEGLHSEPIGYNNREYTLESLPDEDGTSGFLSLTQSKLGEESWCWDVKEYLVGELYPMLKSGKPTSEFLKINEEECEDFPEEDFMIVLELFEEAEKLGWFKK